jgi:hypothetical protein
LALDENYSGQILGLLVDMLYVVRIMQALQFDPLTLIMVKSWHPVGTLVTGQAAFGQCVRVVCE